MDGMTKTLPHPSHLFAGVARPQLDWGHTATGTRPRRQLGVVVAEPEGNDMSPLQTARPAFPVCRFLGDNLVLADRHALAMRGRAGVGAQVRFGAFVEAPTRADRRCPGQAARGPQPHHSSHLVYEMAYISHTDAIDQPGLLTSPAPAHRGSSSVLARCPVALEIAAHQLDARPGLFGRARPVSGRRQSSLTGKAQG